MARYYVNKNAQTNGDHEVHKLECSRLPKEENRIYLGEYTNCRPAVAKAKEIYPKANGCSICSRDCHTT